MARPAPHRDFKAALLRKENSVVLGLVWFSFLAFQLNSSPTFAASPLAPPAASGLILRFNYARHDAGKLSRTLAYAGGGLLFLGAAAARPARAPPAGESLRGVV